MQTEESYLCSGLPAGPGDHNWAAKLADVLDTHLQQGGLVINLGAKWEAITKSINRDAAWELAAAHEALHVFAFEANPRHFERLRVLLNHSVSGARRIAAMSRTAAVRDAAKCDAAPCVSQLANRATIVNEAVHPGTICKRLRFLQQRPTSSSPSRHLRLLLLKVDIDSADLPVTDAIFRCGYRPAALFVEYNEWVHPTLAFTALAPMREHLHFVERAFEIGSMHASGPAPRYGDGYSGRNRLWPCQGASLGMWAAWARGYGYRVVAADKSNALLLPNSTRAPGGLFWGRPWLDRCKVIARHGAQRGLSDGAPRIGEAAADVLETMGARCSATNTPYTLVRRPGGECCPTPAKNVAEVVRWCRCGAEAGLLSVKNGVSE